VRVWLPARLEPDAAHIKPYAEHGPLEVSNGILMRRNLHVLFDKG